MLGWKRIGVGSLLLVVALLGCAGPARPSGSGQDGGATQRTGAPKRITAGILGDPYTLSQAINSAGTGSVRGVGEMEKLINGGLALIDGDGLPQPQLAEAVPSLENGLWRLASDGRMETNWKLKPQARWHDGSPFSSADLVFTLQIAQDKELALPGHPALKAIDGIEAADEQTVTVRWNKPYVEADRLFTSEVALPLPRHILEPAYLNEKSSFLEQPYWTTAYVGTGPFKVREFNRNSHAILAANDQYVLGRPKLDEIVVRFITDPNAMIANLLAGEVELTLGRGFSIDQTLQVSRQWSNGKMESKPANWIAHYPQALTPNPPALGDVRVRRALLHALDRQQMVESLQAGLGPVAHGWLEVGAPEYPQVEGSIVKYNYDPARATQLIEELGYTKAADGFFRDAAGQRLVVESRTNAGDDLKDKILFSSADSWQRVGVGVEPVSVPRQLSTDREYRATYPGMDLVRQPFEPERFLSSEAPLPENRFNGKNRTRYISPELDGLIDRYLSTIPRQERLQILGQLLNFISDRVLALGTFYAHEPILIGNRLVNVTAAKAPNADETWNGHLWDIR